MDEQRYALYLLTRETKVLPGERVVSRKLNWLVSERVLPLEESQRRALTYFGEYMLEQTIQSEINRLEGGFPYLYEK